MKLLIVIFLILCLLYVIAKKRWNAFLSMTVVAIIAGILLGIPLPNIMTVFEEGMGNLLGSLALILGLGAMIAQIMEESGAATKIAQVLLKKIGAKYAQIAILAIGVIIGFALFFDAGFILLIPIVLNVASQLKVPPLYLGLPAAAALLTIHTFFPPHPGAVEIIKTLHVNDGLVLAIGLCIAIPSLVVSGVIWPKVLYRNVSLSKQQTALQFEEEVPESIHFSTSVGLMILPVILIALGSFVPMICHQKQVNMILQMIGHPVIALLITLLLVIVVFGYRQGRTTQDLMASMSKAVTTIAMVLLINGAGGGLKQIFIEGGVTNEITAMMATLHLNPLFAGFLIAAMMRVTLGSSTVAAMTAAGIVQSMTLPGGIENVLIALAIGAGSMFCSHINDPGFWLFKQYFDLSVKDTFKTWTMMTIIGSVTSLILLWLVSCFV